MMPSVRSGCGMSTGTIEIRPEGGQLALTLPEGSEPDGHWQWLPLEQAADAVHQHVKPSVAWLQARAPGAAPVSPYLVHAA